MHLIPGFRGRRFSVKKLANIGRDPPFMNQAARSSIGVVLGKVVSFAMPSNKKTWEHTMHSVENIVAQAAARDGWPKKTDLRLSYPDIDVPRLSSIFNGYISGRLGKRTFVMLLAVHCVVRDPCRQ